MPWTSLLNHEPAIERFRTSFQQRRLASTYLFVGIPGIGKRLFAELLAEALLCERPPSDLVACGSCAACQQVQAHTHPDLILISKPDDKAIIPVELFIGDKEHRRQQGLVHDIGLKPFCGGRKIAIIDDADCLNQEGANSLLKTLEEPPPNSLLILVGSSEQQQLQTIVSRSQIIRFQPLAVEQIETILSRQPDLETETTLRELSIAAEGSVVRALQLADSDTYQFRQQLFSQLATSDPGQQDFAKTVSGFVDAAGKEAAKKRERLVLIADFSISFFRRCIQQITVQPVPSTGDDVFESTVATMLNRWQSLDIGIAAEIAGQAIERCLDLQFQVQANVNPANAIEAWLIELGRICRGKMLTA